MAQIESWLVLGASPERSQMELDLPNAARARRGDPDTSHKAAASISVDRISEQQAYILRLFRRWPTLTDGQIAEAHAASLAPMMSPSGLRTRRAELVRMGKLKDTGQRAMLPSGRWAIVWGLA